jgi:hypothetical protein
MRTGRRYKAYAGETGVTYQYFFAARRRVVRPEGLGPGSDFTFVVTADQHPPYTLQVFVSDRGLEAWKKIHGRELDANEQYAAAKMRLFSAFDECERLVDARVSLLVDEANILELLATLDLA